MRTRQTTNGEVKTLYLYCTACQWARYYTEEARARRNIVKSANYQLLKSNPEAMKKIREMARVCYQRRMKEQQQNWLAIQEEMPFVNGLSLSIYLSLSCVILCLCMFLYIFLALSLSLVSIYVYVCACVKAENNKYTFG